jgi:lipoprotein-anchoring transpeptidase ErfK/SrfK
MHGKHTRRRGRALRYVLVAVGVVAIVGSGTAFAAYRYDRAESERILPGVRIAGVDVGDQTRAQAERLLAQKADARLTSNLVVRAAGQDWTVTPEALGVRADVDAAVDRAFQVSDDLSLVSRLYHRLSHEPVDGASYRIGFTYDADAVRSFVQQIYDQTQVKPVDAEIAMVDGELVTRRSREGQEVKLDLATSRIEHALERHVTEVEVPTKVVEPDVTTAALGKTIVVDISDNTLQLYDGLKVVKAYSVATGAPGFPTPTGTFQIINKVENPTWTNPDPTGWGAGEPAFIPAGPGNPLGTRAMYLNAPGIRIHGTYSSSSIGSAASHGCIRMLISDSEQLYPLVPVGTPVIIKP